MRLLRGRVAIRAKEPYVESPIIVVDRSRRDMQKVRRGVVLGVGEPPLTGKGMPIAIGFEPGEEVLFTHGQIEADWGDERACFVAHSEVLGVVEP
jgi:co-chaperonin GroES (HSP10)